MDKVIVPRFFAFSIAENPHHANSGDRRLEIEVENTSAVSDGYHTFGELYDHRVLLFLAFLKAFKSDSTFRARKHQDGSSYDGWFLVGTEINGKQISYHLPERYWDHAGFIAEYERSPVTWDGHTSNDVLQRLAEFLTESE